MGDSAEKQKRPSFFKGAKAEFKKISWPDRQSTLKMTAKDWQSRLLVSSARWDMRSSASEQTLSTIREYTVRYIFDLLFPSRNSTLPR